jgi:hypothetical protein
MDMSNMIWNTSSLNQPLGNWNMWSVTDMRWMFEGADSFNQLLADWDVSSVVFESIVLLSAASALECVEQRQYDDDSGLQKIPPDLAFTFWTIHQY